METIIALVVGVIVGAVIGVLVYRNNTSRFEVSFNNLESMLRDISRRVDYNNDGKFDLKDIEKLLNDKLSNLKKTENDQL